MSELKKRLHGISSRLTLQKERTMNRLAIELSKMKLRKKEFLKCEKINEQSDNFKPNRHVI